MSAAAPMDGLSLSDEACLSQLRQRLQRDVNCLSDPDRSTRRRALAKLQKAFFQENKVCAARVGVLQCNSFLCFFAAGFFLRALAASCQFYAVLADLCFNK